MSIEAVPFLDDYHLVVEFASSSYERIQLCLGCFGLLLSLDDVFAESQSFVDGNSEF